MEKVSDKLYSWASDVDEGTIVQAGKASRLPIVHGHVALMPDAHVGIGATVGSVIPTQGAVIPSAVGVDIGCGMIATRINMTAEHLPDDLGGWLSKIEQAVPAGVGKGHDVVNDRAWDRALRSGFTSPRCGNAPRFRDEDPKLWETAARQFGSLGSGNHFVEVCLDEDDRVWIVLHSGSRGVGNKLATRHIQIAKGVMKQYFIHLEDPDLAYFAEGTPEFDAYIEDMLWSQDYAAENRKQMMSAVLDGLFSSARDGDPHYPQSVVAEQINCHHNFTQREHHRGQNLWITRKGAIKADVGDRGVIPGSMGTRSYIVSGLGNPMSWNSCSHGAGRRHSRSKAKQLFTVDDLAEQMKGKTWLADKAEALLDEIPSCYKDIDQVMEDQKDLVSVDAVLHQVVNYKGA